MKETSTPLTDEQFVQMLRGITEYEEVLQLAASYRRQTLLLMAMLKSR